MDIQYLMVLLGTTVEKVSKSRFLPRLKVDRYEYGVVGVELTSPWGNNGIGFGLGLGVIDLWFGWPRSEKNLHSGGCGHGIR